MRIRIFLTGLFALLAALLLAFAPASAKPESGGYQLFESAASGDQVAISLASLENFDYHAKIAPECCNATKKGVDGIWDQGRFSPIQRRNAIEDYLAATDYSSWTRVGSQNSGFSPAWDFNQGSTWVNLKTLDTTGSGWQSSMRRHIDELDTWNSPNPNATKVLDIRVQPGETNSAQSLIDYGASKGIQVRTNEF